jgi:hypothetical protein
MEENMEKVVEVVGKTETKKIEVQKENEELRSRISRFQEDQEEKEKIMKRIWRE